MTARAILSEAARVGVRLIASDHGTLKYSGAPSALERLLPEIRAHKSELLALIAANDTPAIPATTSAIADDRDPPRSAWRGGCMSYLDRLKNLKTPGRGGVESVETPADFSETPIPPSVESVETTPKVGLDTLDTYPSRHFQKIEGSEVRSRIWRIITQDYEIDVIVGAPITAEEACAGRLGVIEVFPRNIKNEAGDQAA